MNCPSPRIRPSHFRLPKFSRLMCLSPRSQLLSRLPSQSLRRTRLPARMSRPSSSPLLSLQSARRRAFPTSATCAFWCCWGASALFARWHCSFLPCTSTSLVGTSQPGPPPTSASSSPVRRSCTLPPSASASSSFRSFGTSPSSPEFNGAASWLSTGSGYWPQPPWAVQALLRSMKCSCPAPPTRQSNRC